MEPGDEIHIIEGRYAGRTGKVYCYWPLTEEVVFWLHDAAIGEPKMMKCWAGRVRLVSAIDQLARLERKRKPNEGSRVLHRTATA